MPRPPARSRRRRSSPSSSCPFPTGADGGTHRRPDDEFAGRPGSVQVRHGPSSGRRRTPRSDMTREIYVNLPVRDVAATRRFYAALGFGIDETYSDEACVCVTVSPQIVVMAVARERFAGFTDREVADAHLTTEVVNCLS